ncbi:hypothetical protein LTR99_002597 [Exophiala xenobiotica]|uniref:RING-type E3 ubiquitin transferase n=1 Tax=Vermiconidia calcicola TaxID=1690605 RepID=A0AAV9QEK8_9PEZI|nr:hypothetical protein LTR99_002597 [Exophiala xenobiotica]KAK5433834.1 hypothetical protein LTR34_003346 [Exophiala xenobiotica]KAK5537054.1 hypothetical protein LTR23_007751 [Chaetothyriales sp. CCFEE 6169]KAK5542066.1 hypothetical protein LTR25_001951 [Vermiconidia calcicola]KAK5559042.1 hypothetical protein LTR46_003231 [Exophiala xenobiotica]
MTICKYHARGFCIRGHLCRFEHDSNKEPQPGHQAEPSQTFTLRAEAKEFLPPTTRECLFFQAGSCRNGDACRFQHSSAGTDSNVTTSASRAVAPPNETGHDNRPIPPSDIQIRSKGAVVRFGPDGQVQNVQFPAHERSVAQKVKNGLPTAKVKIRTVCCSWFNPSKIAYLHYKSRKWANSAMRRFERKFRGRHIQCKVKPPPPHHNSKISIWSVQLSNVPADATENELREVLKGLPPDNIVFGKSTCSRKPDQPDWAVNFVRDLLCPSGQQLETFGSAQSDNGAKTKVFTCFKTVSDMETAVGISGTYILELGSKIYVEQMFIVKIPTLPDIYSVLEDQVQELQAKNSITARISVLHDGPHKPVSIRIHGHQSMPVAKAKSEVERLLKGTVVLYDNQGVVWDDYYSTAAGFSYLRSLSQPGKVLLYRDLRRRQLVLHGCSTLFDPVRCAVMEDFRQRQESLYFIPLEGDLWAKALRSGFRWITNRLGKQKAKLDVTRTPRLITITGSAEDARLARELLDSSSEDREQETDDKSRECPVCFHDADNPVELSCGHFYCQGCFEDQCRTIKDGMIPITCHGNEGSCEKVLTLDEIRKLLPYDQFEALLAASWNLYIRKHSDELDYCLTPDCDTVFNTTEEALAVPCENCLSSTCTKCHAISHEGLPCWTKDYEKSGDAERDQQWMDKHHIKRCPKCKTAIEKTGGCHHVICGACRQDICWLCTATFKNGEDCYTHLLKVHGRIDDEWAHLDQW